MKNAIERTINLIEIEQEIIKKEREEITHHQLDKLVIDRMKIIINNQRLLNDGYIWVNRIINYEGGDKYAIREIHPNLPETVDSFLSTHTKDIMGNYPYKAELEGVKTNGELYFDYYFKELKSHKISHKLSYAKLYIPFNWVIATGNLY